MDAIVIAAFGGLEVLHLRRVPLPHPRPRDALVRVHAADVNAADLRTREGAGPAAPHAAFPFIPGWAFSGVVETVGSEVRRFRTGDRVFGLTRYPLPAGTYAELLAVPEDDLAFKPRNVTHAEAATVPFDALTALQALNALPQASGDTLLLHRTSPGAVRFATQLAGLWRLHVTTTDALPKGVVNALVPGIETLDVNLGMRAPQGCLLAVHDEAPAAGSAVRVHHLQVRPDGRSLERVMQWIELGTMQPSAPDLYPLEEAAHAHRRRATSAEAEVALLLGPPDNP